MNDNELEKLKQISPPNASATQKQQAIQSAMAAFEQAAPTVDKKPQSFFQGFIQFIRLIHSFTQTLWSLIMNKYLISGAVTAGVVTFTLTTLFWQKAPSDLGQTDIAALDETVSQPPIASEQTKELGFTLSMAEPEIVSEELAVTQKRAEETLSRPAVKAPSTEVKSDEQHTDGSAGLYPGFNSSHPLEIRTPANKNKALTESDGDIPTNNRDQFDTFNNNPIKQVSTDPVSTFSIDVDTASYSVVRRSLNLGQRPSKDAVRTEEMINYFNYHYALPEDRSKPFKPSVTVYPSPWNSHTQLLHIGIQGYDITPAEKPKSNLVFLLDVSGSMRSEDKLPLLKNAFRLLIENLQPEDTVSIVTYAGRAGTVLEPTQIKQKTKILAALDSLESGGSTAGAQGIKQAYQLAEQNFDAEGVNRIILATDGDFNVGITDKETLKHYVEQKRDQGIYLSILGFGRGNYNDALMQKLAQNGNGNAAYIDTLNEARKVLVDEANSTLFPIAKDVKIQVEFNPNMVSEYRLIGYESRQLKREDFNNDKVDAGDIGAGHSVTAIYEITPHNAPKKMIDDLRYQSETQALPASSMMENEYGFLKIRYKQPDSDKSQLIEQAITTDLSVDKLNAVSSEIRFATSVAAFGQLLRADSYLQDFDYDDIIALANAAKGEDHFGYRSEFINLVRLAKSASGEM